MMMHCFETSVVDGGLYVMTRRVWRKEGRKEGGWAGDRRQI